MHRPAELYGHNQTGQALIGFYCNAQGRRVRKGVAGVAIPFGSFDFDRDVPDADDTRERNTFYRCCMEKSSMPAQLLII